MSLRFASLGSGSRGNALLLETANVRILIDCGFPAREIEKRLAGLSVDPQTLSGIFVTHEHGDHVRGVGALARRYKLPVWMTDGTYRAARYGDLPILNRIDCHGGWLSLGDLELLPFPVPHDAREPCQFLFQTAGFRLGLLTDTGHITPHIQENLRACDSLILEFNHDLELLSNGPYPPSLQARVGGLHGHLSNHQASGLLKLVEESQLQYLLASHLSEKNNTPQKVRDSVSDAAPRLLDTLFFAEQDCHSRWFELS
ncbi:MAG: MBL fold metallo-hydrolase [Candidatus Thiodiazotropha sp. (ex Myrtea sp. 'scaly one' KF741663)]|nr:MBL fold metallo-hydrolase [Candidatus Thiodiazotropha sp. (ex Myrtea sp. 'scaly one' KF741663)]